MEEIHRARYGERVQSFHALSTRVPLSQHLHMFTNPEALQTPSFWGFMKASLYNHD